MSDPIREQILEHVRSNQYRPQKPRQIARSIDKADDDAYPAFREALLDLMHEGRVIMGQGGTILLPADLAGRPSGEELLARTRREVLAAQDHQDLPLEVLVADLQPERDLSRNPLFSVLFSFHDSPVPDLEFAGLRGTVTELHNGSAKADLNVVVRPRRSESLIRIAGSLRELGLPGSDHR